MTARMHAAFRFGGIGQASLLDNGQRVHVSTKGKGASVAARDVGKYAGSTGEATYEVNAGRLQLALHDLTCASLFVRKFWVSVQVVTDVGQGVHGFVSLLLSKCMPATRDAAAVDSLECACIMPNQSHQLGH
jgi:hypothetical protein